MSDREALEALDYAHQSEVAMQAKIDALIEALEEARTTLSLTRTNIMVEIGRCADPSESRWEGVPELLKERLNQIDAALSLAKGGQA